MAFGRNGLDFVLKIEKPLSSQAVYVAWQQSHALILHILPTSSLCGSLRATLLQTEVIMIFLLPQKKTFGNPKKLSASFIQ